MLFTADMLIKENYVQEPKIETFSENECYFETAIAGILEMNNIIKEANRKLNIGLLEAGNNIILINESFDAIRDTIVKIINKFLDLIKKITSKFIVTMNSLIKNKDFLKKHFKDLEAFSENNNFDMKVFEFTNIETDEFPKINAYKELTELTIDPFKCETGKEATSVDLVNHISNYKVKSKEELQEFYGRFRGVVLGRDGETFTSTEYDKELFKFFRGGESDAGTRTIDYEMVRNAMDRFDKYKANLDNVEKLKRNIEIEYKKIRDTFKSTSFDKEARIDHIYTDPDAREKVESLYNQAQEDIDKQINFILKNQYDKVDHMCKIHSLAFAAKLDAIKAAYKQDTAVLYKALNKVGIYKIEVK